MKIICTSDEKVALLWALDRSTECPLLDWCPRLDSGDLTYPDCHTCIEQNVEWKIVEGESDDKAQEE